MRSRAKFRLFRRQNGIFFVQDNESGRQESLRTRDRDEARRLFAARNEAHRQPAINLQIARAYLTATDPKLVSRTWQEVVDQIVAMKDGPTEERWAYGFRTYRGMELALHHNLGRLPEPPLTHRFC
jgi:hypothetical protein